MKIKVLRFTFLCFLPMIFVFVSPLIFYNLPIAVRVDEVAIELTVFEIFYATFVWIVWVFVAGAIVIVGQNNHDSGPHWDIHERGLWWSFIICGTLGSCIAIVHQLVQFPRGFENLIHILAFSPMIALIFGMYLLCWKNLRSKQRFLVAFLCIPSVLAIFCLPLILGYVNPMVISALGILYALSAMAIRWRIQVGALGFFVLLIGTVSYTHLTLPTKA